MRRFFVTTQAKGLPTSRMAQSELKKAAHPAWKRWGPYLSERQWGTVREDYSSDGSAWEYLSHDAARSRAYRWGEDGIGGISDCRQLLCFSLALWNGKDPILKERFFGLTGNQGNHGEDVKELYYYLDNVPSHSYMKMLYKYPHERFPYEKLVEENRRRGKEAPEYELLDTGLFKGDNYFDVTIEYAKASPTDICIRITALNRGKAAHLSLIPQLWFRNTWSWDNHSKKSSITSLPGGVRACHLQLEEYYLFAEGEPRLILCDNETNAHRLFEAENTTQYPKDTLHRVIVDNESNLSYCKIGTKAGFIYSLDLPSHGIDSIRLRLSSTPNAHPFADFETIFQQREKEADQFYGDLNHPLLIDEHRAISRQAYAGMLWSKQFYSLDISQWLSGDPSQPTPPETRINGRNSSWLHLSNSDIISMPDKWEYPWYAAWDLAFHTLPLAKVDPSFAKDQLILLTQDSYMHPNGQLPAYEWSFSDVNPPVHAWAALRVFEIDAKKTGKRDTEFLQRIFHRLLLNFTWWVNQKDTESHNIFQGGFLGLDNIGVFDRSNALPTGGHLEQADGTAWIAMYSLNLMRMALELSLEQPTYQDLACKFFDHFLFIAHAMVNLGGEGIQLWDEEDQFYYDVLHLPDDTHIPLRVRSFVGIIPLFAVEILDPELLERVPLFTRHVEHILQSRPELASLISRWHEPGKGERRLLSLVRGHRMKRILARVLDEAEFLSPFGIRSLSRFHLDNPYEFATPQGTFSVRYQPAESDSSLFGGNSNWRGPIWFPVNYLLVQSLRSFHRYYGDDFLIECPIGSGTKMTIAQIADELSQRMIRIFEKDTTQSRPVHGSIPEYKTEHFRDHLLFYEYFDAETGRGVGASHQTGWTGLIVNLLHEVTHDR